jgi:golgi-specific brefeldin A-resistance guanine nucleotide exchange factor 1
VLPAVALCSFLDAIRSEEAGAVVTSASLAALHEVMALTRPALSGAAL